LDEAHQCSTNEAEICQNPRESPNLQRRGEWLQQCIDALQNVQNKILSCVFQSVLPSGRKDDEFMKSFRMPADNVPQI
jgi:hypothetical protein